MSLHELIEQLLKVPNQNIEVSNKAIKEVFGNLVTVPAESKKNPYKE